METDIRSTVRPTPLRLAGFLATVVGGVLVALGPLLTWVSVGLLGDESGALTSTSPGVDHTTGKIALALGAATVVAIVLLRVIVSVGLRRLVAIGVLVAGLASIAIGVRAVTGDRDRYLSTGVRPLAEEIHRQVGLPVTEELAARAREQLAEDGFVQIGVGPWLVLAGGIVTVVGGALDLAWVEARA